MTFSDPIDTPVSGPGPVPVRTEEPTIGALVHDLSQQLPDLIRSEPGLRRVATDASIRLASSTSISAESVRNASICRSTSSASRMVAWTRPGS